MARQVIALALDKKELQRIIDPQMRYHSALIELGVAHQYVPDKQLPCIETPFHVTYHADYLKFVRIF